MRFNVAGGEVRAGLWVCVDGGALCGVTVRLGGWMCALYSSAGCVGGLLGREGHSVNSGCVFFLVRWVSGVPVWGWGGVHISLVFRVMGGFTRCPAVCPLLLCMVLVLGAVRHMSCFSTYRLEYRPTFQACPLFLCNVFFLGTVG